MPTYLLHGFRWQRPLIRIHIAIHDLEDAAAEWLMAPATSVSLLNSFYTLYDFLPPSNPPPASYTPENAEVQDAGEDRRRLKKSELRGRQNGTESGSASASTTSGSTMQAEERTPVFNDWSAVKILEQYDPRDVENVSQPYAYIGDHMVEVPLGASVSEEMAKYERRVRDEEGSLSPEGKGDMSARDIRRKSRRLGWLEKLRDGLQKGADIGWFVVVVGDEERVVEGSGKGSVSTAASGEEPLRSPPRSAGLKGFFNRRKNIPEE